MSKYDVDEMIRLYQQGIGTIEIGRKLGCHAATVKFHVVKRLGSLRPPKRYDWPIEDMRKWYEVDRMTLEEIGQKLGVSSKVVNKVCKRNGFQMRPRGQKFGSEHKGWKGGRRIDKDGYVLVYAPDHPNATKHGVVREHRLVMEQKLGRLLHPHEVVHHIDGNKSNNHPDNLGLFQSNAEHLAETLAGKCPNWSEDGKRRIREACRKAASKKSSRAKTESDGQESLSS